MTTHYFNGKEFIPIEDPINWEEKKYENLGVTEILIYEGWCMDPVYVVGHRTGFPMVQIYEWNPAREKALEYIYFIALFATQQCEDVYCKTHFEVLEFLNKYAPAFQTFILQERLDLEYWQSVGLGE